MKRAICSLWVLLMVALFAACSSPEPTPEAAGSTSLPAQEEAEAGTEPSQPETEEETGLPAQEAAEASETPAQEPEPDEEQQAENILITVGDTTLTAVPEENSSAEAFLACLREEPITVSMSDYGNMEKVGPLGMDLPRNDTSIHVGPGDVILYQGNQITIYYDTNTWSFTKLATIQDATQESLLEVLGTGDVSVTFSLAQ